MRRLIAILAVASAAVAAPSEALVVIPRAQIDPERFASKVDNAWYPLAAGTIWVYRGVERGEPSRDVVTVTARTKTILGVRCVVVSDNLYVGESSRSARPTGLRRTATAMSGTSVRRQPSSTALAG